MLALRRPTRAMATSIVARLLAAPKIHPRDIDIPIEARAARRHAFQRAVFEAAFPAARPRVVSVARGRVATETLTSSTGVERQQ